MAPFRGFPKEGLQFLRSLKRNNSRVWFLEHKGTYEVCLKRPMAEIIEALAADFKRFAPEMIASTKISAFRIHRDTRFSKDKSPYKTHVAAVFPRSGLPKDAGARLYFHVDPSEVWIGGGMYMPLPEDLSAIRAYLADNHGLFRKIVGSPQFRKLFGSLEGEQLSRVPRGFRADHPAADYLKYKQFLAGRTLPAGAAIGPSFYGTLVETFRGMLPFIRFLNEPIVQARRTKERQEALLTP
jgi:uncharacterized protein (TIGR02453 family)